MGADTSGTMQPLIDKFNKQSKDFKVQYREMPTDTGAYFDKLRTQFQAGGGDIDVIGADVIWPVQFAASGWLLDVTDRFPKSEQSEFLPGPIQSLDVRRQDLRRSVVHGRGPSLLPGGPTRKVRLLGAPQDLGRARRDGLEDRAGSGHR